MADLWSDDGFGDGGPVGDDDREEGEGSDDAAEDVSESANGSDDSWDDDD